MDSFKKAGGDWKTVVRKQQRCSSEPPSRSPTRFSASKGPFTKVTDAPNIPIPSDLETVKEYKEMNKEVFDKTKETNETQDKLYFAKNLRDTLTARFLSMIIGCFVYLLTVERRNLNARIGIASDGIDWIHIGLYILFPFSIVAISQLLWDMMHHGTVKVFMLFKKAPTLVRIYRLFGGTVHGCAALCGFFLSKHACYIWKESENKASCLERSGIGKKVQKVCEYQVLRMTVAAERYFCENASQMCSKAIYLLPYLIFGGILILIGNLVAFEYFLAPDIDPEAELKPQNKETDQISLKDEMTDNDSTLKNE